jgi:hypothetical protein
MRLTLSGFDDTLTAADLESLRPLLSYRFLELGILFSHRDGRPRYPAYATRQRLAALNDDLPLAAHLCGPLSRSVQAGDAPGFLKQDELRRYARIQINGFRPEHAVSLCEVVREYPDKEFILQVPGAAPELQLPPNVSVLLDASGGLGLRRSWLELPQVTRGLKFGCAGGFRPETLESDFAALPRGCSWMDLETGLRSADDRVCLEQVERMIDGFWGQLRRAQANVHAPSWTPSASSAS